MSEKYKNKEWLYKQKIVLRRLTESIAKECSVHPSTISKYIRRFNIKIKIRKEFILECNDCKIEYKNKSRKKSKDGKSRCRKCQQKISNSKDKRDYQREYCKNNKEKIKKRNRKWQLKNYYNITQENYNEMLDDQNGVCAICKNKNFDKNSERNLSIDHCHDSGNVRGLLCDRCNRAIGSFKDNPVFLQNAILYLIKSDEDKSWDRYFINIASIVSTKSKDKSTQVGAILVKHKVITATGYNGFPRNCDDLEKNRNKRPLKYKWVVHAEENVLLNSGRQGISTLNTTMYVTPIRPCYNCVKAIIQCGVKRVVCQPLFFPEKWEKDFEISKQMIKESGIEYKEI